MYNNNYYAPAFQQRTPYYPMQDNLAQLRSQQMPMQMQGQPQMQAQTQNNNGLIWVQGETGAKSFLVAPNTTVMLMDSETSVFYLKSADASGMPLPLRTFKYEEVKPNIPAVNEPKEGTLINMDDYVTKAELQQILATLIKSEIQTTEENNDV